MLIFLDLHLGPPPPNLDLLSVSLRRRLRKTPPPPLPPGHKLFVSYFIALNEIAGRFQNKPSDFSRFSRARRFLSGYRFVDEFINFAGGSTSRSIKLSPGRPGIEKKEEVYNRIDSRNNLSLCLLSKKKKKTIVDHLVIPRKRNLINRTTFNRYSFHRSSRNILRAKIEHMYYIYHKHCRLRMA